jgi:6-phosphogluconolactonase (cycloisomerase 2 family)
MIQIICDAADANLRFVPVADGRNANAERKTIRRFGRTHTLPGIRTYSKEKNALIKRLIALPLVALGLAAPASPRIAAGSAAGAVFTLTNQSDGNAVLAFRRDVGGALTLTGSFPTGGAGTGTGNDPLGSQGAVVLDQSARLLFAVNAGSNDVSAFAVDGDHLELLNRVYSGGTMPVSIAVHGNLVYVLNAGGVPDVAGFTINPRTNELEALSGSERSLAGGTSASPADVSFSSNGDVLMVTEKGTQTIDTYVVGENGYLAEPTANPSSGDTPFGFQFTHRNVAIVSEAGTSNALSSYGVDENGQLALITGSLQNGQAAVCWTVVTEDGRYAYSVNAGSGTISSYAVSDRGALDLLNAAAASTGALSAPTDAAMTRDSRFLYVRIGAFGRIHGFRVERDGRLSPIGAIGGIPLGSQGLAVR